MKQFLTGRLVQAAGKYGEVAPQAAVCCNVCRTCVTTNVLGIAAAGATASGLAVVGLALRFGKPVRAAGGSEPAG